MWGVTSSSQPPQQIIITVAMVLLLYHHLYPLSFKKKPSKELTFDCPNIACVSPISKASLVDSARGKVAEKASNMNASRTRFVIAVEAMLTNPTFLEQDEVRAAPRCFPTTCLLLGFFWDTEVIMVYACACKILIVVRLKQQGIEGVRI
jgi:hypothetical protein|eukprot:scaffold5045_cov264-Chaetoceros_neogracile.AAC.2